MRFSITSSLLGLCLSYTAYAAEAPVAHVYTFDKNAARQPPEAQSVSPETARLIFAQRLGLSQLEEIRHADDQTLKQLNWFGGRWQAPFQLETQSAPSRSVILFMESVDFPEALMGMTSAPEYPYSHFTMTSPPSPAANTDLLSHFYSLAKRLHPAAVLPSDAYDATLVKSCFELINRVDHDDPVTIWNENIFIDVDILKHYTAKDKSLAASKEDAHLLVRTALTDLQKVAYDQGLSLTIALFPPVSKHTKRSSNPYGKRNLDRLMPEEPLSMAPPSMETSTSSTNTSIDAPAPVTPLKSNSSTIIKGILPACFTSQHACQSTTSNCTGHGSCYLKYRDTSKDNKECWSCGCKATVTTNAGGLKKTTNWGGPACQKKDVSVAFWILAGFTVLLVGMISWGIGLMYSMGEVELPSVIGAGVSGPRAK